MVTPAVCGVVHTIGHIMGLNAQPENSVAASCLDEDLPASRAWLGYPGTEERVQPDVLHTADHPRQYGVFWLPGRVILG